MVDVAATATGGEASPGRSGGKPGGFHRSAYLSPPLTHSRAPGAVVDASAILIELGQSGGPNPHSERRVSSLLARQLDAAGFDTSAWNDLAAFDVAILHPGRTLIEKLLRINNFASDPAAREGAHGWPRIFTPDLPVPVGGFAASSAFDPEDVLAVRLRIEHEAAMKGPYYGTGDPPTFADVLDRVHTSSSLLEMSPRH